MVGIWFVPRNGQPSSKQLGANRARLGLCNQDGCLFVYIRINNMSQLCTDTGRQAKEPPEKEQRLQEIVAREINRTFPEKYSLKETGKWLLAPGIISLVGFGYSVFYWFDTKEINWLTAIVSGILLALFNISHSIEEDWTEVLHAKWKAHRENPTYKWADGYLEDHIYTDSKLEYGIYLGTKLIAQALSVITVPILALIALGWISSIGPLSIISGLLVVVIFLLIEKRR